MKNIIKTNKINKFLVCFLIGYFLSIFCTITNTTSVHTSSIYLAANKQYFLNLMTNVALDDMKESGVYASVTLGQAVI